MSAPMYVLFSWEGAKAGGAAGWLMVTWGGCPPESSLLSTAGFSHIPVGKLNNEGPLGMGWELYLLHPLFRA